MRETMKRLLPGATLVASLAAAHLFQEKPVDTKIVELSSGNYMVKEFDDRYEVHHQALGGATRKMYDYGKDGELDILGRGPKGLSSGVAASTYIDERHRKIYQEIFSKLD